MQRFITAALALAVFCTAAAGSDKGFALAVDPALTESGLTRYILPRFSLKTGVRVTPVPPGTDADLEFGADVEGAAAVARDGVIFAVSRPKGDQAKRFRDWLLSDVGQSTVEAYAPETGAPFIGARDASFDGSPTLIAGDVVEGERLSLDLCGRCHVVSGKNRMSGIGSTPSFAVLKSLPDWESRFSAFWALKPHPAFTRIDGMTEPFDPDRPPHIFPVEMTLDDLDAILAFVSGTAAADLGAPLESR